MTTQEVKAIMGEPRNLDSSNTLWLYGDDRESVTLKFSSLLPGQPQMLREIGKPFTPQRP